MADRSYDDGCRCTNDGQYGRVRREHCPIHGDKEVLGDPARNPMHAANLIEAVVDHTRKFCPTCRAKPGEQCGGHPRLPEGEVHLSRACAPEPQVVPPPAKVVPPSKDKRTAIQECLHANPHSPASADAILNALHQAGWAIVPRVDRMAGIE